MMDSTESLKEKCLSVVVENFEWFYSAFQLVSEGTLLEKQFRYLERAFSETLFDRLLNLHELKAEHFDFLINPHIKRLNLKGIDENLLPALVDRLNVVDTNNIVFLKASFWSVTAEHYKKLISMVPNLEVIEISEGVYPEVLEEIGKRCPLLKVFKILSLTANDDELKKIFMDVNGEYEAKTNLEQLDISNTLVTNVGVAFVLDHAPSLKSLEYCNVPGALYEKHGSDLVNNCIEETKKYKLTSLSFPCQRNMVDILKVCTAFCPDVSSLCIHRLENDEQLLLCSKFRHLKDIELSAEANSLSFESITQLLKLRGRGLYNFQLKNGCMSAETLIEHCPKLHSLKLDSVQYNSLNQSKFLFSKVKLTCLKTLSIINCDFSVKDATDSVKLILSNAKNLNSVNFSGAEGLTEDFIRSILPLGLLQIHELNLNSSDAPLPPIAELLAHGNLKRLHVKGCSNITETEYFHLLDSVGDRNVVISFEDDESATGSSDHVDYDYSDGEDDYYDFDYDDYIYSDYEYVHDEYDDFFDYDAYSPYSDLYDDWVNEEVEDPFG